MTTLTLTNPVCNGIAGFRSLWDTVIPLTAAGYTDTAKHGRESHPVADWSRRGVRTGRLAFDAVHRQLLVRFPKAAETLAQHLRAGKAVKKLWLVLPYAGVELAPPGDTNFPTPTGYWWRSNWGVLDDWARRPPRWHAKVEALRRPWSDPTYNRFRTDCYWSQAGAYGGADRHRTAISADHPEVSAKNPLGRFDLTRLLTDPAFGPDLASRLTSFEACGLVVAKLETYDHHYYRDVYEWGTAIGCRAILIKEPYLEVELDAGTPQPLTLPDVKPPASHGTPQAVVASKKQVAAWAAQPLPPTLSLLASLEDFDVPPYDGRRRPRPVWWSLLSQSNYPKERLGPPYRDAIRKRVVHATTDYDAYLGWVDQVLSVAPRGWHGFSAARDFLEFWGCAAILPDACKQHILRRWEAWLSPDRPTTHFEHPMADKLAKKDVNAPTFLDTYVARTDDWRGDKSFFRGAFVLTQSTQNINITAVAGALLGGRAVNATTVLAEARQGLAGLAYLWFWGAGTSQEDHDHYYLGQTLVGLKVLADHAPTAGDRLLARSYLTKGIADLLDARHPNLRRFTATSNRTSLEYVFHTQDGPDYVCHAITGDHLHDLDRRTVAGLPTLAHEVSPVLVAHLTQRGDARGWQLPAWAAAKELPFGSVARKGGRWQTCYQGRHYGLSSESTDGARVQVVGHWEREPSQGETLKQGTLLFDFGVNGHRLANDAPGFQLPYGKVSVLQHKNRLLIAANVWNAGFLHEKVKADGGLASLSATIALYLHGDKVKRETGDVTIGKPALVRDGRAFVAVTPLAGKRCTVRWGEAEKYNGVTYPQPLLVTCYLLEQKKAPVTDFAALETGAVAFAVEIADETECTWQAFSTRAIAYSALQGDTHLRLSYEAGGDRLQGSFPYRGNDRAFVTPLVNGKPPYPTDLDRDTPTAQQSRSGRVEKGGATLTTTPKRCAYLLVKGGSVLAMTPDPEPAAFRLALPGGGVIEADGPVTCCRVEATGGVVAIECVEATATFEATGLPAGAKVSVNGKPVT